MNNKKKYLGFNDLPFMAIGIPLCGFLLPFFFFNINLNDGPSTIFNCFWITSIYVVIYWIGVRRLIISSRKKYTNFKDSQKRILSQLAYAILFAYAMKWVLNFVFISSVIRKIPNLSYTEPTSIQTLSAIYLVMFLMLAVYESIYLYDQLRISVQEKEQVKQEQLKSELQGLRDQLNPHFLFNSLNTLMNIIPQDSDLAIQFLQRMSKVYRYILESREEQIIPLQTELDFIHSYVFLLEERFKNKLEVQVNIPDKYLNNNILPLTLQLLIENAIKHNVISKNKPLLIEITILNNHYLMVRNNLQLKKQVLDSTKVGLENIRRRYQFFTENQIKIAQTEHHFSVMIPLINQERSIKYSSSKIDNHGAKNRTSRPV